MYKRQPLVRAYGLEKALGTPAHIYFKNESVSPIGSHKLNSALAQAYYCKQEGVTNIKMCIRDSIWRGFGLDFKRYLKREVKKQEAIHILKH